MARLSVDATDRVDVQTVSQYILTVSRSRYLSFPVPARPHSSRQPASRAAEPRSPPPLPPAKKNVKVRATTERFCPPVFRRYGTGMVGMVGTGSHTSSLSLALSLSAAHRFTRNYRYLLTTVLLRSTYSYRTSLSRPDALHQKATSNTHLSNLQSKHSPHLVSVVLTNLLQPCLR